MEPRSPEGVLLTENQFKRFVKVRADHMLDGKTLPLKFRTEDGPEIKIDRITDVRRAAATKAGGQGKASAILASFAGMKYICFMTGICGLWKSTRRTELYLSNRYHAVTMLSNI